MNDTDHDTMFRLGDWTLQKDIINKQPIASIKHHCNGGLGYSGYTIWFHGEAGITECYCGARVPDTIQGLCVLFNLEWIQKAELNG